jgi:RNA polymerase sigma-70 factor (ECF subfamily)
MTAQPDPLAGLRPRIFGIAYRMLGSASDAEDVVQETLLRLHAAGLELIRSPESFATTVATRLCLDLLRSARVRRERYFGTWLPEPLVDQRPDVQAEVETAESISMAVLVLMESLSPLERAAFLLREVFEHDYSTVAEILQRSEPACRQLVARARHHIEERKPRFEASPSRRDELATRFLNACRDGDLAALTELLAADAVFAGDGGGNVPPGFAVSKPVHGRTAVALLLSGLRRRRGDFVLERAVVNGQPGICMLDRDQRFAAVLSLDIVDGSIQTVRSIVNPDKLRHLGPTADLLEVFRR